MELELDEYQLIQKAIETAKGIESERERSWAFITIAESIAEIKKQAPTIEELLKTLKQHDSKGSDYYNSEDYQSAIDTWNSALQEYKEALKLAKESNVATEISK
ncbi:MAG: hypothetical protein ACE5J9_10275 [Methanosarcinales archaeon]